MIAAWLFIIGVYGIVTSRNLVHLIICLSVLPSSSYVLLISVGYKSGATAPVFADVKVGTPGVDPVVQALCLADVVVGATVTALLLSLAIQSHKRSGTLDPDRLGEMPGPGCWTGRRPGRLRVRAPDDLFSRQARHRPVPLLAGRRPRGCPHSGLRAVLGHHGGLGLYAAFRVYWMVFAPVLHAAFRFMDSSLTPPPCSSAVACLHPRPPRPPTPRGT